MNKILVLFFSIVSINMYAQNFQPGIKYFGANNYIEYNPGTLPIIISAPHGGRLTPNSIPNRTVTNCNNDASFSTAFDSNTQELVRLIEVALANIFGCKPHIVICLLDRDKLDCNRAAAEAACGNSVALQSWNDYHNFIYAAKQAVTAKYGRGIYIDVHGHGHSIQRNEIGYTLSASTLRLNDQSLNNSNVIRNSSIRQLSNNNFTNQTHAQLLRGANAFGTLLQKSGFPSVPSLQDPSPKVDEEYFEGGYNTNRWSSADSGTIDGFQIETNFTGVRDNVTNMRRFADSFALAIKNYIELHAILPENLQTCTPLESSVALSNKPFLNNSILIGRYQTGLINQKVTLLEVDPTLMNQTTPVQVFDLPSTNSSDAFILTNLATDGQLTLSPNKLYATIAGYNLQATSANSIFDHTTSRMIGVINGTANFKSYVLPNSSDNKGSTDPFNISNIRSAITTDGNKFYVSGGVATSGSLGGIWFYNKIAPTEATQVFNISNARYVTILQNQLFALHQANSNDTCQLIQLSSSQLPTNPITVNDTTKLFQPVNNSVIGVQFSLDGNYCYVVANSSSTINGHLQKWKKINNKWMFLYNIIAQDGFAPRGFTASFTNAISELYIVYATNVVKIIDTLERNTPPTNIQTIYSETTVGTNLRGICFSPIVPTSLPIHFSNFYLQKNGDANSLKWSVLNAENTVKYNVQKSSDGISFYTIQSVNQTGNSSYFLVDKNIIVGKSFYRIVAISKQNEFTYSNILWVENQADFSTNYSIVQNNSSLVITFNKPYSGSLSVIDLNGKLLEHLFVNNQTQIVIPKKAFLSNKIVCIKTLNRQNISLVKKTFIF